VVLLDELVEVHTEQLEHQAQVPAEHEVVQQAYCVVFVVGVEMVIEHF
jgi:hypothetical protein